MFWVPLNFVFGALPGSAKFTWEFPGSLTFVSLLSWPELLGVSPPYPCYGTQVTLPLEPCLVLQRPCLF